MAKTPPLERISMTIPRDVLRKADQLASRLDRSRSWVIAEAVRQVREPPPPLYEAGEPRGRLDSSRSVQLAADLRLSPEARVVAAERTAREAPPRRFGQLFVTFDRWEDYFEWKRLEAAGIL